MNFPIPPDFAGTPEDFLDLIMYLQDKVSLGGKEASLEELGIYLAKEMNVTLSPYESIAELLRECRPSGRFTRNWRLNELPVDHTGFSSVFLSEKLLTHILDEFPAWGNSPEQFLKFIRVTIALSHLYAEEMPDSVFAPVCSEEGLAEIFMEVFKIDIGPYRDFRELSSKTHLEIDALHILNEFYEAASQEMKIDELIQSVGLEPSQETVFEELLRQRQTRSTIDKLRPYIHFY